MGRCSRRRWLSILFPRPSPAGQSKTRTIGGWPYAKPRVPSSKKAKLKPADISAIGLSGQMHGSVFLADGHKPLRPALLWNDQRTSEQCAEIEARAGGREALIELVANPALTGFTAPKILWVRQNEPRVFERTKHILLPKDYIRYPHDRRVRHRSQRRQRNPAARCGQSQVVRQLLELLRDGPGTAARGSRIARSYRHGRRRPRAELGLRGRNARRRRRREIRLPGRSATASSSPGIVSATLGTSGVVFAHSDVPSRDPKGRVHTMCHAVPGKWCVFGCMLSAGGSFQWFRNQLGEAEMAAAKKRKRGPVRAARRRGRAPRRPGPKDSFSSPTSPANVAPIPTRSLAAAGSA